jgi:sugar lactone lactonase YvrE
MANNPCFAQACGGNLTANGINATNGNIYTPTDVAVGPTGLRYIASGRYAGGNSFVYRVNADGTITTVAGGGSTGLGDGGFATNASLSAPGGIVLDAAGNLFIADSANNRVREVLLTGSPSLILDNANAADAGTYQVIVSNP